MINSTIVKSECEMKIIEEANRILLSLYEIINDDPYKKVELTDIMNKLSIHIADKTKKQNLIYYLDRYFGEIGFKCVEKINPSSSLYRITAEGYNYINNLRNSESKRGFCAMWFDSSMNNVWNNAINPAIIDAGYTPIRIDESHHNND